MATPRDLFEPGRRRDGKSAARAEDARVTNQSNDHRESLFEPKGDKEGHRPVGKPADTLEASGSAAHNGTSSVNGANGPHDQATDSGDRAKLRWQQIATIIAALAFIATVVVNSVQLSNSGTALDESRRALDQNRRASELQQLSEIDGLIRSSNGVFGSSGVAALPRTKGYLEHRWTTGLSRQVRVALGNMDYIAFLFNDRYLTLPGAWPRWHNALICAWKVAAFEMPDVAAVQWPDLRRVGRSSTCVGGAQPDPGKRYVTKSKKPERNHRIKPPRQHVQPLRRSNHTSPPAPPRAPQVTPIAPKTTPPHGVASQSPPKPAPPAPPRVKGKSLGIAGTNGLRSCAWIPGLCGLPGSY